MFLYLKDMADISLDVPAAYLVLERWVIRCRQVILKQFSNLILEFSAQFKAV
jgi:hypothetical protein